MKTPGSCSITSGWAPQNSPALRDTFLAVRHTAISAERAHTWTHQMSGSPLEEYTSTLERDPRAPEDLLPAWAVREYQRLRNGVMEPRPAT